MFRWGVEQQVVRGKQHDELPEAPAVMAVDDAHVDAALPYMRPQVKAMVELMRLTGMRPGDGPDRVPRADGRIAEALRAVCGVSGAATFGTQPPGRA